MAQPLFRPPGPLCAWLPSAMHLLPPSPGQAGTCLGFLHLPPRLPGTACASLTFWAAGCAGTACAGTAGIPAPYPPSFTLWMRCVWIHRRAPFLDLPLLPVTRSWPARPRLCLPPVLCSPAASQAFIAEFFHFLFLFVVSTCLFSSKCLIWRPVPRSISCRPPGLALLLRRHPSLSLSLHLTHPSFSDCKCSTA